MTWLLKKQRVAALHQAGSGSLRNGAFDHHTSDTMVDARRLAGFLNVHSEINQIDQHLRMALGLVITAHHAERHPRLAILHHERWNQRVQRPLMGTNLVRVGGPEREERSTIVENDACVSRHDSGIRSRTGTE